MIEDGRYRKLLTLAVGGKRPRRWDAVLMLRLALRLKATRI